MTLRSTSALVALAAHAILAALPGSSRPDPVHLLDTGAVPTVPGIPGAQQPTLETRTSEAGDRHDAFLLVAGKPVARRVTIDLVPTAAPETSGPFKSHLARLVRTLGEPTRQASDTLPYLGGNILIVRTAKTRTWDLPGGRVVLASHRTEFDLTKAKEMSRDMVRLMLKEKPDTPNSRTKELESMAVENFRQGFVPEATVQLRAWDTLPVEAFARALDRAQREGNAEYDASWGFAAEVPSQRIAFHSSEAPESWFSLAGGTTSVMQDTVRTFGDTATSPVERRVKRASDRTAFESRVALPNPGLRKFGEDQIALMIRESAAKAGRNGSSESDLLLLSIYASLLPRVIGPVVADFFQSRTLIVTHDWSGE